MAIDQEKLKAAMVERNIKDELKEDGFQMVVAFLKKKGVTNENLSYADRKKIREWAEYAVHDLSVSVAELLKEKLPDKKPELSDEDVEFMSHRSDRIKL